MGVSAFAKSYIALLKTYPLTTNLGTAMVIMTTGDAAAQVIESSKYNATPLSEWNDDISSNITTTATMTSNATEQHQQTSPHALSTSSTNTLDVQSVFEAVRDRFLSFTSRPLPSQIHWNQLMASPTRTISGYPTFHSLEWLDPFRSGSMACWSLFYSPFYVTVYRLYDKFLPKGPSGVLVRVALTFATSIPVNAAFYTYGTTVQYTHEWWQQQQQQQETCHPYSPPGTTTATTTKKQQPQHDDSSSLITDMTPYNVEELRQRIIAKLEAELPTTITRSAYCWIPANLVIFSVVPSHLQPLSLMFGAVFWNCYLSLTQHRDVPLSQPNSDT